MPSLPWNTYAKRQNSQLTLVNTTPPPAGDPTNGGVLDSDTASTKGSMYTAEPESEPIQNRNSSQVSLVTPTPSVLPPVSAARNLMQRKFSTATNMNVRKRTKDVAAADDQIIRLREENLALAAQLDELRSQMTVRDQELSASKLEAGRMAEEKEDLAKQLSDVRSQLVTCEQDLAASKAEATRITDENGALMGQVTALQTELEDGRKQFAQALEVSKALKGNVESMETRVGELENEVNRMQTTMEEHSRRVRDMLGGFIIRWWVGLR